MSNNALTGSEPQRFEEIHDRWLVFEPVSNENYNVRQNLYTVDPGQTKRPEFIIYSGSVPFSASTLTIEKDIHIFYDETEALEFIANVGTDNISVFQETDYANSDGSKSRVTEVHVINYPEVNLSLDIIDFSEAKGFIANVYLSSSVQDSLGSNNVLLKQNKKIKYDKDGRISSDTYLKYFKIEGDK